MPARRNEHPAHNDRQRRIAAVGAAAFFVTTILTVTSVVASLALTTDPILYHTSILSGEMWVQELLSGHPERIRTELGMQKHVFLAFCMALRASGMSDSRYVTLHEQVAIFLYMSVTGLKIRHVGERFQRSNETISHYFRKVLYMVTSYPFYNAYVHLPGRGTPVPPEILGNPKWFPYFSSILGAIDGTHFRCSPGRLHRHLMRDRKGGVTQNVLAACGFDLKFHFIVSGWDGSTTDSEMFTSARLSHFCIPAGRRYLADAGFGICEALLIPFRGVRYHLAEWGRALLRPQTAHELFNLRHASARNIVERIFGVLKERFGILDSAPEFDMEVQARIPSGMGAVHNFIRVHDPEEIYRFGDLLEDILGADELGDLATSKPSRGERAQAMADAEQIAKEMFENYQDCLRERGML